MSAPVTRHLELVAISATRAGYGASPPAINTRRHRLLRGSAYGDFAITLGVAGIVAAGGSSIGLDVWA